MGEILSWIDFNLLFDVGGDDDVADGSGYDDGDQWWTT